MAAKPDATIRVTIEKHPTRLAIETEGEDNAWAVSTRGFDGALGQVIPRRIGVSSGNDKEHAVIAYENTYALASSIVVHVPGFADTHVSREYQNLRRSTSLEGEGLSIAWDAEGNGYTLMYCESPIAHVQEAKRSKLGTSQLEISSSREYALLATCVAAAIALIG